ncbi:MAG: hypothetical protein JNL70_12755 [Saprospiraceae bacterium]|nr:hypothetical protein [Saprospiraceae bacterium]
MAISNYSCSQAELYTTCRTAWLLCQQYLQGFSAYKSKYTPEFITDNLALISSVESMGGFVARTMPVKELRKELLNEKSDLMAFFVRLKGYVVEVFKGDKKSLEANCTEMGQAYYDKIGSSNWSDVSGLLSAMVPYVKSNQALLMEKGYMPATFLSQLEEKEISFKAAYETWKGEYEASPDATNSKIVANNDLKERVMAMLADGQAAFFNDKTIAQKFVWATLLAPVRGLKPMGFTGKTTDKTSEGPLSKAMLCIDSLNMRVPCDKNGRYQAVVPTAEKLTLVFKAEGYEDLVLEAQEVKLGVMSRLNVAMKAIN